MTNKLVPEDFPRGANIAALSGAHPKLTVRRDRRTGLYIAGPTEEELSERYEICSDLVDQLVAKCQRNRTTKYASMTENAILASLFSQLTKRSWGSQPEMAWVIRHIALALKWPRLSAAELILTSAE